MVNPTHIDPSFQDPLGRYALAPIVQFLVRFWIRSKGFLIISNGFSIIGTYILWGTWDDNAGRPYFAAEAPYMRAGRNAPC